MHSRLFYVWHSFEYPRISCSVWVFVRSRQRDGVSEWERESMCMYFFAILDSLVWKPNRASMTVAMCGGCLSMCFVCNVLGSIVCAWTRYAYVHIIPNIFRTYLILCFVHAVDTALLATAIRLCSCCCAWWEKPWRGHVLNKVFCNKLLSIGFSSLCYYDDGDDSLLLRGTRFTSTIYSQTKTQSISPN